jgi:c-di-GMP-binding flagellar brake protein YcgR
VDRRFHACYSDVFQVKEPEAMNESGTGFDRYLKPGLIVSVQGESQPEVAAVVGSVVGDLMSVNLMKAGSKLTFQEGQQVRIKYWNQKGSVYHWTAKITQVLSEQDLLTVSTQTSGRVQHRKSHRVTSPVRFSFTVIEATDNELIGKRIVDCKTKNLSMNGILFETDLSLKVKDKVGLDFHLQQKVNATGWVVRSEGNGIGDHLVAVMFLQLEEGEQRQLEELLSLLA